MRENPRQALINLASLFVGVHESPGNRGTLIEMFQKSVDGVARGEPYCVSFIQWCVAQINSEFEVSDSLHKTESSFQLWKRTTVKVRRKRPYPGCIIVWRHGDTQFGHVGIVTRVIDGAWLETIEANTSPSNEIDREGQGIYRKKRKYTHETGSFRVVGFLDPWGLLEE